MSCFTERSFACNLNIKHVFKVYSCSTKLVVCQRQPTTNVSAFKTTDGENPLPNRVLHMWARIARKVLQTLAYKHLIESSSSIASDLTRTPTTCNSASSYYWTGPHLTLLQISKDNLYWWPSLVGSWTSCVLTVYAGQTIYSRHLPEVGFALTECNP